MTTTESKRGWVIPAILVAIVLLGGLIVLVLPRSPTAPPAALRTVTMNGDDGTGAVIDPINVWDDYQTRGRVVAALHPGDRVQLVRDDGAGVLIRASDGTEGWVSRGFIVELK